MDKPIILIVFLLFYNQSIVSQSDNWSIETATSRVEKSVSEGDYIWACTWGNGLVRIEKSSGNIVAYNKFNSPIPTNFLSSIATDIDGIMWIGTLGEGLIKYDGNNWKVLTTMNSPISTDYIHTIEVDHDGTIWIGYSSFGGLDKFDGVTWTNYKKYNSGLISDNVGCISFDSDNNLWIGTQLGVVKFDGTNWYNVDESSDYILSIEVNNQGHVFAGTFSGLKIYNGSNWDTYTVDNSGLPDNQVRAITLDNDGNLCIGTRLGLTIFDGQNWITYNKENSNLFHNQVNSILIDNNNTKWVGIGDEYLGAITKIQDQSWSTIKTSESNLPSNLITTLTTWDQESITIGFGTGYGTGGYGFANFKDNIFTHYDTGNSDLLNNDVSEIIYDLDGNLWIGSNNGGLQVINNGTWEEIDFGFLRSHSIHGLAVDYENNLWIGWYWDLVKYNYKTGQILQRYPYQMSDLPDEFITDIAIDSKGSVWVGTMNGLAKIDGEEWTIYHSSPFGLPGDYIVKLAADSKGTVWILNRSGGRYYLSRFSNNTWTTYNDIEARIPTVDLNDNLWVATPSGLAKFDGNDWTYYTKENSGLPSENITAILIGENKIWLGTDIGLAIYDGPGLTSVNNNSDALDKNSFLSQNYPNPFNPSTTFQFSIPKDSHVNITIYNSIGEKKEILLDEYKSAGTYKINFDGSKFASGIYFYQMIVDDFVDTKKMVLIK